MIGSPRTLHLDRDALPSRDRASTLEEALSRLVADDYDTIILHTRTPGRDDYDLVSYLIGTWPQFLSSIKLRTVCGASSHLWNVSHCRFERELVTPAAPSVHRSHRAEETQIEAARVR